MYINKVKEKLKRGEKVIGMFMHEQSRDLVEILGLLGYDYLFLDAEHGALTPNEFLPLVVAAERRNIVPMIRTSSKDAKEILRYLELGAMGLIYPDIKTAEEANDMIQASKYYPQGNRGMATMRAADYGITMSKAECRRMANEQIMCIMQIESKEGFQNRREIMSVPGVDAIIFGPNDFSQDIGIPGEIANSRVQDAIKTILDDGKELGVPVMCAVSGPEHIAEVVYSGASLLFVDYKTLLVSASKPYVEQMQIANKQLLHHIQ